MPVITVVLLCVIFLGAMAQRVSGLGFALLASPMLALLLGPHEGVLQVNFLALFVSITVLLMMIRNVDWRRAAILVLAGLLGVFPGVLAVQCVPTGPLQIVIALTLLLGLIAVLVGTRARISPTPRTTIGFGLASGFMTATTGTGGPALTVYAVGSSWAPSVFAATVQLSFAIQQAASLALKGFPDLKWVELSYVIAIFAGLWAGGLVAHRVAERWTRWIVVSLAIAGSTALLAKGIAVTF